MSHHKLHKTPGRYEDSEFPRFVEASRYPDADKVGHEKADDEQGPKNNIDQHRRRDGENPMNVWCDCFEQWAKCGFSLLHGCSIETFHKQRKFRWNPPYAVRSLRKYCIIRFVICAFCNCLYVVMFKCKKKKKTLFPPFYYKYISTTLLYNPICNIRIKTYTGFNSQDFVKDNKMRLPGNICVFRFKSQVRRVFFRGPNGHSVNNGLGNGPMMARVINAYVHHHSWNQLETKRHFHSQYFWIALRIDL